MGWEKIVVIAIVVVVTIQLVRHTVWPLFKSKEPDHTTQRRSSVGIATSVSGPIDENTFWELIEAAWSNTEPRNIREHLSGPLSESQHLEILEAAETMFTNLEASLLLLEDAQLKEFDRITEEKLYQLDSASLWNIIEGSDDSFLYNRGFLVALGEHYFNRVLQDPRVAIEGDLEEFCFAALNIHHERTGTFFEHDHNLSRETCSNSALWPPQ